MSCTPAFALRFSTTTTAMSLDEIHKLKAWTRPPRSAARLDGLGSRPRA